MGPKTRFSNSFNCKNYILFICSNRPREQHVGPSNSGPGPHCPRCGKTVYEAERAIGLTDVSYILRSLV